MKEQKVTVSRVLINRKEENELIHRWCNEAAGKGGWFSLKQEWTDGNWYSEYVICWPAATEHQVTQDISVSA